MDTVEQLRRQLETGSRARRAWAGAWSMVQGALLALRSPALLKLALPPIAIHLALYPVSGYAAWRAVPALHHLLFPFSEPEGWWTIPYHLASWFLYLLLGLVLGLVALWLVSLVASIVASPFLDALSERAEGLFTRRTPPTGPGPLAALQRAVVTQGGMLLAYVVGAGVCLALSMLPLVGYVLGPALQACLTLLFLAMQMMDLAAERHGVPFQQRVAMVRGNVGPCLGFGAMAWFLLLFPFTLPMATVGGTLLFLALNPDATRTQPPARTEP